MIPIKNARRFDFDSVPIDAHWNTGRVKELKMHRIHAYPAKFPAFITTKALQYAKDQNVRVKTVADVFCGCGTTAFEARRNGIEFWGCDINPVATLIAKAKSHKYQSSRLERYLREIRTSFLRRKSDCFRSANPRLQYWYKPRQYNDLHRLLKAIKHTTPIGSSYQLFFLCAFSNILKGTSVWLTKSIKPQVDPDKKPHEVLDAFLAQCEFSIAANSELGAFGDAETLIVTGDFLGSARPSKSVDMVITSPPYVTSYEYADLHQLSSLWLGFASDYRDLREGAIGSLHHEYNLRREWKNLNKTGSRIVSLLVDGHKEKARSVAKYFIDMQNVAQKTYAILRRNGIALFVVGNTEYKSVRIDNVRHLAESLICAGFRSTRVSKRTVSGKILTPYRDERGKFSTDSSGRQVYGEEFVLVAQR